MKNLNIDVLTLCDSSLSSSVFKTGNADSLRMIPPAPVRVQTPVPAPAHVSDVLGLHPMNRLVLFLRSSHKIICPALRRANGEPLALFRGKGGGMPTAIKADIVIRCLS